MRTILIAGALVRGGGTGIGNPLGEDEYHRGSNRSGRPSTTIGRMGRSNAMKQSDDFP
jgi:hypothetical protein